MSTTIAPEWTTTDWFNSKPLTLAALRGRVVVLGTFQMLCPGCVSTGLPQLQRVYEAFDRADVAVVGLHTVFEHHAAMTPVSLDAFIHEYHLAFPIGVDAPGNSPTPVTMTRYGFRGTPSLVLIDRTGVIRLHQFGHVPDLKLGATIQNLVNQAGPVSLSGDGAASVCSVDDGCQ